MLSQSYSLPAFELPQPRWVRGLLLALAAHAALVLLFYWPQTALEPVVLPPPAVMMSWAVQIEAPESKPLPLGVQQAESAAAQPAEQQQQPDLPKLARAEKAKIVTAEKKRAEQRPPQKTQPQPKPQEQAKETRNAAASSAAAPQAQTLSHQTAAPINSDANSNAQAKLSWESLVKGKLNRIKDYPLDARSRRRSGMPQVSFSVDAQGRVSNVTLLVRSGTASLDREAVAVVSRAQPLPPPPPEMLQQGAVRVTMPIDFNLAELNARR
ncbi:TonB family protein [Serratia marcescens]|uniref:TonB family protein n=1 Tax=Serratia marcescens TaxID=615 RepID=UPI003FA707A9